MVAERLTAVLILALLDLPQGANANDKKVFGTAT
jgi:hypothetical protein